MAISRNSDDLDVFTGQENIRSRVAASSTWDLSSARVTIIYHHQGKSENCFE